MKPNGQDEERDAWIAAHGSERLRLALSLDLAGQSLGVYRDERLAHEIGPLWQWADRHTEISEAINPSMVALAGLRQLRDAGVPVGDVISLVKIRTPGSLWREALVYPEGFFPWAPGRLAFRLVQP